MQSEKWEAIRPNWGRALAEARLHDRRRRQKAWSCLAMCSGGFIFSVSYKWALQALAKEASPKNIAIGILTCSAAASVSSVALVKLLFGCKTCKERSKRSGPPLKLKAQESSETTENVVDPQIINLEVMVEDEVVDPPTINFEGIVEEVVEPPIINLEGIDVMDPPAINLEELNNENPLDLSASMEIALEQRTERLRKLSGESQEMCKRLGTELKTLGDKVDATVDRLNASAMVEESDLSNFSENQKLCMEVAKELKRITAEVGRAAVNLFTPKKKTLNLSEKNKILCKDIGTLLKNPEFSVTLTCSPNSCFFCCEESSEQINAVLRIHESHIEDTVAKRESSSSDPLHTLHSIGEMSGAVLQRQVSALLGDYERHRKLGSADDSIATAMTLYRLLAIIVEDFSDSKLPELLAVDNTPQLQSASHKIAEKLASVEKEVLGGGSSLPCMQDQLMHMIGETAEKRDQSFKDLETKHADLAKRFQNIQETESGSKRSRLCAKWACDSDDASGGSPPAMDFEQKMLAEVRKRMLNTSKFPLLQAIGSPFLTESGVPNTISLPQVFGETLPTAADLEPVEPKVNIPWPCIKEVEQLSKSSVSESPNIEELVGLVMRGLDTASSIEENVLQMLGESESVAVPELGDSASSAESTDEALEAVDQTSSQN